MKYIKTKRHSDFKNYLIDEDGNVYSKINGYDNGIGYRLYKLTNNLGEKKYVLGHRLTYEAWNEEIIPNEYDIHHKNFIRDDNHIDNLDCMPSSENRKITKNPRKRNSNGQFI